MKQLEEQLVDSGNGVGVRVHGGNIEAALRKFRRVLDRQGRTGEMIEHFCDGGISGRKLYPGLGPARYGKPFRSRQQQHADSGREY